MRRRWKTGPCFFLALVMGMISYLPAQESDQAGSQWNVLFLAVDDLNDWIGCLGGHPQARTPHLDQLAARSILFTNAHCQAPICNPSRISLLTGKLPSTTGVYYLGPRIREWEATQRAVTIPQHFQRSGYDTWGVGKIYHTEGPGEFAEYGGKFGGFGPRPSQPLHCGVAHPLWDWGRFPLSDEEMPDYHVAEWARGQLSDAGSDPFFLACGFFRPHVPMYAPAHWFDLFADPITLPPHRPDDFEDVPSYGQDLSWSAVAPRHQWFLDNDQWETAVHSYLASVAFVDEQVGRVLQQLEASGHADSTIVVLWSDHGFHLGTKERWGKRSLWEDAAKVPLMIHVPGYAPGACDEPVGLIDLYPTLIELCGLDYVTGLEGHSLVPLLQDPERDWPYPAITTFGQHNHAVRSRDFRFIQYADGSEELYDHRTDPDEFHNLASDPRYAEVLERHRRFLPQVNLPMAPGSVHADARPGSPAEIEADRK